MKRLTAAAVLMLLSAISSRYGFSAKRTAAALPAPPPRPAISSCQVPLDVAANVPPDDQPYEQRPFFDDYSWKAFAAVICDAKPGERGVPSPAKGKDGAGARVFETYKSAWEVFHGGTVSGNWKKYEAQTYNPCEGKAKDGDLVLASVTKFLDTEQRGVGDALIGPLPAQNGTYVHYLTQYNEKSFGHIVDVLAGKAAPGSEFPDGSVNVKSAWVEMNGPDGRRFDARHFYVRDAWIRDYDGSCKKAQVGLVGLHIVQKTPTRKNWIWSTFEQVDNVPNVGDPCPVAGAMYTFNREDCKDMPVNPVRDNQRDAPPKTIFNVQRTFALISQSTKQTNQGYQALFSRASKWKNYELVMTQWPLKNPGPTQAANPMYAFPGTGATTAFANTVMETFFQRRISLSCLGCHGRTAGQSDLVWSLRIEPQGSRTEAFKELRTTMTNAGVRLQ